MAKELTGLQKYMQTKAYREMIARRDANRAKEKERKKKNREKQRTRQYSRKAVKINFLRSAAEQPNLLVIPFRRWTDTKRPAIPHFIVHDNRRTFYVEIVATGETLGEDRKQFHAAAKARKVETYVLDVKITNWYDLLLFAYTTYPGTHHHKAPENRKK